MMDGIYPASCLANARLGTGFPPTVPSSGLPALPMKASSAILKDEMLWLSFAPYLLAAD